ncbi:mechanosensitive ion channel domain-containing protein [Gaetbulibacter aquiaggeris]|uniref:Mechanosensitive ion channel domain-containing protein n=1 Tax=Gaetbulibacter aquiaggeris TaxID=1735373 RepID=A0ABW7MTI4_9FLAO
MKKKLKFWLKGSKKGFNYLLSVLMLIGFTNNNYSQQSNSADLNVQQSIYDVAWVTVDGVNLFKVRGISALPAQKRADNISKRIQITASNEDISIEDVRIVENDDHVSIYAGNDIIVQLYEPDGDLEGVSYKLVAKSIHLKIIEAITTYRYERSAPVIRNNAIHAVMATVVMVIILLVLLWIIKRIDRSIQKRIKARIEAVENISFNLIRSNQIWNIFHALFKSLKIILIAVASIFFIDYVLKLFPWTKSFSIYALKLILDPLKTIAIELFNYLPELIFLIVIFFITKYILKLLKLFFIGVEKGGIVLKDFRPEWSIPTFKIIKLFIIAFAVIISYPYIPGSESVAFKGVSVFMGVLVSLGSSSLIGNTMAGYSMIYRGAFKKGDLIKVDDQMGFVEEQKLQVTRLRTLKNEEIIIPNSILINSKIMNYSVKADGLGILIHTTVGIGYETPWRLVDAMLKLAADRTEGILKEPPPFVLKKSLDDYAVSFEINGYCKDVSNIKSIYSKLHDNILDVFNENDVQIMTPSYRNDPDIPKVVPENKWYQPLAKET